jgi:hypothetical protein
MSNKFVLEHGVHRGSPSSRDAGSPEEHDTYEQAHASYQRHKAFYRKMGYQIWYAEIIKPDGTKVILEENPCY